MNIDIQNETYNEAHNENNNQTQVVSNKKTKVSLRFPWLSTVFTLIVIGYFILSLHPEWISQHIDFRFFIKLEYQLLLLALVINFILWDIRQFYSQRHHYEQSIKELFKAKKQLQKKAQAYSGHSDKLKLFISERLLEYIQYDEKFLHFKNIAAEVRHNGVICYDKVQTALDTAITLQEKGGKYSDLKSASEDAMNSMRYLWDLLDLSTTDNIALHIGNYLCECEEHYFQSLLQNDQQTPYTPTYKAHSVIISCLESIIENPEGLQKQSKPQKNNLIYSDSTYFIKLDTNIDLLGNPNHLRLLAENLINNAQFYSNKKHTAKTQTPIAVELINDDNEMLLSIYNRGQHIKEENTEKIFQLGYSTRRKKNNHGKGLGLYFANSIAQGYEGSITFKNIHNSADTYSIRIQLQNDQVVTEIVETRLVDTLPVINSIDSEDSLKQSEWSFNDSIKSIEIFSKLQNKTYKFDMENVDSITHTDPENTSIPAWSFAIKKRRRSTILTFIPLDISGVKFQVNLPTAKSRLDYSDENMEQIEEIDKEPNNIQFENIIELEKQFKS
jgi:signal transduction histidine kinase